MMQNNKQTDIESLTLSEPTRLFDRVPTEEYIQQWTDLLLKQTAESGRVLTSVIAFRLGKEWLALPTNCLKSVTQRRQIHVIPHRNNKVLIGLMSLEGELQICVSLSNLLEIELDYTSPKKQIYERMVAIEKEQELWIFPVEEIDGIHMWDLSLLENVPVTISKSTANYLKGIMNFSNKNIGFIDEELLFYSLKRSVL